jgi:tRNA dimethylallyltransferase
VPHHGLDLVDPDVRFTVTDFADHAGTALAGIAAAGGFAILVGGTGLYLRAVARGLPAESLPHDAAIRADLEAELAADGLAALAGRLEALAPLRASRTDLRNPRRVVRALEIATIAGDRPPPPWRGYPAPVAWLGLALDRAVHGRRVDERTRAQFAVGLLEEAGALRDRWNVSAPAFSAIGYREAWAVIDGALGRDAAIELMTQRTTAFARRQSTWFRAEPDVEWLDVEAIDPLPRALEVARGLLERRA